MSGCHASKPLKPFQGLKLKCPRALTANKCFKASKTLSGIETKNANRTLIISPASKPLKPFQGLKHQCLPRQPNRIYASKPLKPFQGLKHRPTLCDPYLCGASKPLKPFQGLKQVNILPSKPNGF